jgi:transposase
MTALWTVWFCRVTAEAMSFFLEEVARRHQEKFILMFLDGAGWHRANDLTVPKNMRLESLPPYSPQLNPVEHIWDEIREKWFTNEVLNLTAWMPWKIVW